MSSDRIVINRELSNEDIVKLLGLNRGNTKKLANDPTYFNDCLEEILNIKPDSKSVGVSTLRTVINGAFSNIGISRMTKAPLLEIIKCMAKYSLTGKDQMFNKTSGKASSDGKSAKRSINRDSSDDEKSVEPLTPKQRLDFIRVTMSSSDKLALPLSEINQYIDMYHVAVEKTDIAQTRAQKMVKHFIIDAIEKIRETSVKKVDITYLRELAMYYRPSIDLGKSKDTAHLVNIIQYGLDDENSAVAINSDRIKYKVGSSDPYSYGKNTLRAIADDENAAREEKDMRPLDINSKVSGEKIIELLAKKSVRKYSPAPLLWEIDLDELESSKYFDYPYRDAMAKYAKQKDNHKKDKSHAKNDKHSSSSSSNNNNNNNNNNNIRSDTEEESSDEEIIVRPRQPVKPVVKKPPTIAELIHEFGKTGDFSEKAITKLCKSDKRFINVICEGSIDDKLADIAYVYFGSVLLKVFTDHGLDKSFRDKFMDTGKQLNLNEIQANKLTEIFNKIIPNIEGSGSRGSGKGRSNYVSAMINGFRAKHVGKGASIDIKICASKNPLSEASLFKDIETDVSGTESESEHTVKTRPNIKPHIVNSKPVPIVGDVMSSDESDDEKVETKHILAVVPAPPTSVAQISTKQHLLRYADGSYLYIEPVHANKQYTVKYVMHGSSQDKPSISFEKFDEFIATELDNNAIEIPLNMLEYGNEWNAIFSIVQNGMIKGMIITDIPQRALVAVSPKQLTNAPVVAPSKQPRPSTPVEVVTINEPASTDSIVTEDDVMTNICIVQHVAIEMFFNDILTGAHHIYGYYKENNDRSNIEDHTFEDTNKNVKTIEQWKNILKESFDTCEDIDINSDEGKIAIQLAKNYYIAHMNDVYEDEDVTTSGSESDVSPRRRSNITKSHKRVIQEDSE